MHEVSSILEVEQARRGSDLVPKEEQPRYLVDSLPVYTLRAATSLFITGFVRPQYTVRVSDPVLAEKSCAWLSVKNRI